MMVQLCILSLFPLLLLLPQDFLETGADKNREKNRKQKREGEKGEELQFLWE